MPIRVRLVLFFTIGSVFAMSLGGWYFLIQLRSGLIGSLDANIATQWVVTSQSITSQEGSQDGGGNALGSLLAPLPVVSGGTEYLIQLLGRSNKVIASNHAAGSIPLLKGLPSRIAWRGTLVTTIQTPDGEPIRVRVAPLNASGRYVVVVGASLASINLTIATVRRDLIVAGTVIVGASALGAYLLAIAALSPVERLRRQVSTLSERNENVAVEVPRTNDEIAALARTMNSLLGRLHEALVRQRSFVADAGHELRTPFAILQAELELAARPGRSSEELRDAITSAADEAARLLRLAEDLLFLARSDQATPDLSIVHTGLRSIFESAAGLVMTRCQAAKINLIIDVPFDLAADLDPSRVRQAVDNLVDNALRFAPEQSAIVLSASQTDLWTRVSVSDQGPGFPEEYLPLAFERFQRPDDSRSRQDGGTGLGLAIVAAIASWHHGRAFARNRSEGGAEVGIEIPTLAKSESIATPT